VVRQRFDRRDYYAPPVQFRAAPIYAPPVQFGQDGCDVYAPPVQRFAAPVYQGGYGAVQERGLRVGPVFLGRRTATFGGY
jgi:hypothetical protein